MGVVSKINEGREAIRSLPTSPEAMKAAGLNMCHSAIATCKGSGSIKTELTKLAGAPINAAGNILTSCKDMVTGHPIDAIKDVANACTDVAKAMISPVPIAIATATQSCSAVTELAKAPVTVPLAAYRVVDRGLTRVTDKLFGNNYSAPANDNASAKATPPPPAPADVARAA